MPTVSFYTLGCKLNYAETTTISRDFQQRRFEVVPFGSPADVTVINTCTVTEEAERKCRQVIRRILRKKPDTFVAVTGCYAQLRPEQIAGIPGVDVVFGMQEKFHLFALVDAFVKQEKTQVSVSCIDEAEGYGAAYAASDRTRAFLKVQDGCDYTCSFCTIPLARGRSRSAPIPDIVRQAQEIAEAGFREIVLSGVNIGLFGQERGETFLGLLKRLERVEGIERYRISSIEPNLLTDAVIDFVAGSVRFMPHLHIPLQSGDDYVLGKMRRRYRRSLFADRVETACRAMPDACIGADVIVGAPYETAERFQTTVDFVESLPLAYLHVFTYSERPDTAAVRHIEEGEVRAVPAAERSRRNRVLHFVSEKQRRRFYAANRHSVRPVLWEGSVKNGRMFGFTDNYIRVARPHDPDRVGVIEEVTLGDFGADDALDVSDLLLPVIRTGLPVPAVR